MVFVLERFFQVAQSILLRGKSANNSWCFFLVFEGSQQFKKSRKIRIDENTLCDVWWFFWIFLCLCLGWMQGISPKVGLCFPNKLWMYFGPQMYQMLTDHPENVSTSWHILCCVANFFLGGFGALYICQQTVYGFNNSHVMAYMLSQKNPEKNVQQRGCCPSLMIFFLVFSCHFWRLKWVRNFCIFVYCAKKSGKSPNRVLKFFYMLQNLPSERQ